MFNFLSRHVIIDHIKLPLALRVHCKTDRGMFCLISLAVDLKSDYDQFGLLKQVKLHSLPLIITEKYTTSTECSALLHKTEITSIEINHSLSASQVTNSKVKTFTQTWKILYTSDVYLPRSQVLGIIIGNDEIRYTVFDISNVTNDEKRVTLKLN